MRAAVLMAWMLSGCAAVDGGDNYEEGWRAAVVESVAPDAAQLARVSLDCRHAAPQAPHAYVRYESALRPRHAIVAVPEGLELQVGQRVYINLRDCSQTMRLVGAPGRRSSSFAAPAGPQKNGSSQ